MIFSDSAGYHFAEELSDDKNWAFIRDNALYFYVNCITL